MARLLIMLVILLIVALVLMALYRRVTGMAADARTRRHYRVLELTSNDEAQVLIGRGAPDTNVLIGSVPVGDADFDERYAELVVRAEDRVATLNASRELHDDA